VAQNWDMAGIGPEWAVTRLQTLPKPVFNLTVLHLLGGGSVTPLADYLYGSASISFQSSRPPGNWASFREPPAPRCERGRKIHKTRCCNHLHLWRTASNWQLGQPLLNWQYSGYEPEQRVAVEYYAQFDSGGPACTVLPRADFLVKVAALNQSRSSQFPTALKTSKVRIATWR
jgi:hypothetical protein